MVGYVAGVLNKFVADMRDMGETAAATQCDAILGTFNKNHSIRHTFGSLDDSVQGMANELRDVLVEFGKPPFRLNKISDRLNDWLEANTVIGDHAKLGRVVVLKKPVKFIKDWIDFKIDDSQKVSMKHKANEIADLCNQGDDLKMPVRLKYEDKVIKGVVVAIYQKRQVLTQEEIQNISFL